MKLNLRIILVAAISIVIVGVTSYVALVYGLASMAAGHASLLVPIMIITFASAVSTILILYFLDLEYRIEMEKEMKKSRKFIDVESIMNMISQLKSKGADVNARPDDSTSSEILMFSIRRVYRSGNRGER
ncbi:MAG: hypothetical protein GXO26_08170 [Crenarchaeota archaeon]|nr:hypothetical protein [Thermoproteota archaeon]